MISEFVRRYDFELVDGYKMQRVLVTTQEPKDPVEVNLKKRV